MNTAFWDISANCREVQYRHRDMLLQWGKIPHPLLLIVTIILWQWPYSKFSFQINIIPDLFPDFLPIPYSIHGFSWHISVCSLVGHLCDWFSIPKHKIPTFPGLKNALLTFCTCPYHENPANDKFVCYTLYILYKNKDSQEILTKKITLGWESWQ